MAKTLPCSTCGRAVVQGSKCPEDGTLIPMLLSLASGLQVGEYVLDEQIGEGGMGEVWAAHHPIIEKKVAIKILQESLSQKPKAIARFQQEARAVNQIGHANLVDIFAFGTLSDTRPYLVMEFLQGKSLKTYLKQKGILLFAEIKTIFEQLTNVLQAVHNSSYIHRDLKPDNVFLLFDKEKSPFVKVLDFGIAKLTNDQKGEDAILTKTGGFLGTPTYMSPEQARGSKEIDHRSDIYCLGIILFKMLTGQHPFFGPEDTFYTFIQKMETAPIPIASKIVERSIPAEIEELLVDMLAKNAENRPASCLDVWERFVKATEGFKEDIQAVPTILQMQPVLLLEQQKTTTSLQKNIELPPSEQMPLDWYHASNTTPNHSGEALKTSSLPSRTGDYYTAPSENELHPVSAVLSKKQLIIPAVLSAILLGIGIGYLLFYWNMTPEIVPSSATSLPTLSSPPISNAIRSQPTTPIKEKKITPQTKPLAKPDVVKITFQSIPEKAVLFLGEKRLGSTPFTEDIPYGEEEITLQVKKNGYQEKIETLMPNQNDVIHIIQLEKRKPTVKSIKSTPKKPKSKQENPSSAKKSTLNTPERVELPPDD